MTWRHMEFEHLGGLGLLPRDNGVRCGGCNLPFDNDRHGAPLNATALDVPHLEAIEPTLDFSGVLGYEAPYYDGRNKVQGQQD